LQRGELCEPVAAELVDGGARLARRRFLRKGNCRHETARRQVSNRRRSVDHVHRTRAAGASPRPQRRRKRKPVAAFRRFGFGDEKKRATRGSAVYRPALPDGESGVPDQLPLLPPSVRDLSQHVDGVQARAGEARHRDPGARDSGRPPRAHVLLRRGEALGSGQREEDHIRFRGEGEEHDGVQPKRQLQRTLLRRDAARDQNRRRVPG